MSEPGIVGQGPGSRLHELRQERCGRCQKWMTRSCPREQLGRKPTCNDVSCNQFVRDAGTKRIIAELMNGR